MEPDTAGLAATAKRIRRRIVDMTHRRGSPHIGSSLSTVEVLVALFHSELSAPVDGGPDPERNRFILSKGHACPALYAALAEFGYCDPADLDLFAVDDCIFEQHPNLDLKRGIELSTGSLGHGLSVGAGMALAARIDGRSSRVFVLMSDGELNEGSVWEAIMFSGHHGLSNLIAFVDANKMQALGNTADIIDLEPISVKWREFGWHAQDVDGHDIKRILSVLSTLSNERPNVVILHTVKGKGVSFMENNILWHYRAPDDREYEQAIEELLE